MLDQDQGLPLQLQAACLIFYLKREYPMPETVKISKIFLLIEKFQKLDRSLINMILVLGLISILCLYSIDKGQGTIYLKHLVRFIFAFSILTIVAFTHVNFWYRYAYHFYFLILFLLIVLKFIGVTAKGAQRWLDFGFFHVQPSEVAKLAIILVLAKFYNLVKVENTNKLFSLLVSAILILIPFLLVLRQPDLGTAVLILGAALGTLWIVGLSRKIFISGFIIIILSLPFIFAAMKPYQKQRVVNFFNTERDPLGANYQVIQAKIGIGSGGIFGKGYLRGSQSSLDFVPENHTDFVFSHFAEEFGLVGSLLLLWLFFSIIKRVTLIGDQSKNNFSKIFCYAFAFNFFLYIAINLGMVTGLLPVVGVPLPILSYGGTAMLTNMIGFGIVLSSKLYNEDFI
jgi:rod shape determining protein RodA